MKARKTSPHRTAFQNLKKLSTSPPPPPAPAPTPDPDASTAGAPEETSLWVSFARETATPSQSEAHREEPVEDEQDPEQAGADESPGINPDSVDKQARTRSDALEDPVKQAKKDLNEPDNSTEAIRARVLRAELKNEDALEEIPEEHLSSLQQMATPVELLGGLPRAWGRRTGLLLLSLLLGMTLAGQYFWHYKDQYSLDPRFRTAYQTVCNEFSCLLPEYSEPDAIRSDNLAVRSHPQRTGGLMLTVEIRNTASVEQLFPILILSFNSANNETIALREFSALEYLDPGLQGFRLMPVRSPITISIPLLDPGPDAVNYTLAFRSP